MKQRFNFTRRHQGSDVWRHNKNIDLQMCDIILEKYFKYPEDTLSMTLILSTEDDDDSYIVAPSERSHHLLVSSEREQFRFYVDACKAVMDFLLDAGQKECYVSMQFDEEV